jgi:ADP-ribosylglycohydrolase
MRVAPIGGFFAGDPQRSAAEARLSAEVTHAHPEGLAGAVAIAVGAALAAQPDFPRELEFLKTVLGYVPAGLTNEGVRRALDLPPSTPIDQVARSLGNGGDVSAQDTVPFCLWCAAYHLDNFEEALWTTVSGLGDRDTTCAMVGGIVALSAKKIPEEWIARREPLPINF